MTIHQISLALFAAALLSGCATVTRGTTEDVVIKTTPDGAKVVTSLNHKCDANPCTVKVSRKAEFTVTASKEGYRTDTVLVKTKVSSGGAAGLAGNVIIGGLVGAGVDVATGAARDHSPNPVIIDLQPVGSKKPRTTPKKKPSKADSTPTS